MENESTTIIGVFSDPTAAKHATDELRDRGITTVRLVENDQGLSFVGTEEPESATIQTGISAFFAHLFGVDKERSLWSLNADSEAYFQESYNKKNHLVVVEDCSDLDQSREVIARLGGIVEEEANQYYQQELSRRRDDVDSESAAKITS